MTDKPTIRFNFDGDRYLDCMTWDMIIAVDEWMTTGAEIVRPALAKQLCAIFLTDDEGKYYPMDEALRVLGGFSMRQVTQAANNLVAFIKKMQNLQGQDALPLSVKKALSTPGTTEPTPP
jgi:hypothetical protein